MKQLSDEFGDDLAVIAFPTGEFGGQELPTDEAIAKFAYDRVKFPAAPRGVFNITHNITGRRMSVGPARHPAAYVSYTRRVLLALQPPRGRDSRRRARLATSLCQPPPALTTFYHLRPHSDPRTRGSFDGAVAGARTDRA